SISISDFFTSKWNSSTLGLSTYGKRWTINDQQNSIYGTTPGNSYNDNFLKQEYYTSPTSGNAQIRIDTNYQSYNKDSEPRRHLFSGYSYQYTDRTFVQDDTLTFYDPEDQMQHELNAVYTPFGRTVYTFEDAWMNLFQVGYDYPNNENAVRSYRLSE